MTITEMKPQSIESLGVVAYKSGMPCFPQLDETLQEIVEQNPENSDILYANWTSAWKLAYLAQTLNCGS